MLTHSLGAVETLIENSHELLNGIASLPWMLLTSTICPDLLEIMDGRTPATLFRHESVDVESITNSERHTLDIFSEVTSGPPLARVLGPK